MWQGHRDGLISAAFAFGLISLIVTLLWWLLFCVFQSELLNQIVLDNIVWFTNLVNRTLFRCILKKYN